MTKTNIKASNSIMCDKQFKLSDLIPGFRFRTNEDKTRIGCQFIVDSLFVSTRKGEKYLVPRVIGLSRVPDPPARMMPRMGTV